MLRKNKIKLKASVALDSLCDVYISYFVDAGVKFPEMVSSDN